MKGIEGLPFKYITMIAVATIVIAAMLLMLGQFETTAKAMTQTYNGTLHETLSGTLAKALSR